jgi:hypothetical protein
MTSATTWVSKFVETELGTIESKWRRCIASKLHHENGTFTVNILEHKTEGGKVLNSFECDEQNEFSCEVSTGEVIGVEAVSRRAPMDHTVM